MNSREIQFVYENEAEDSTSLTVPRILCFLRQVKVPLDFLSPKFPSLSETVVK